MAMSLSIRSLAPTSALSRLLPQHGTRTGALYSILLPTIVIPAISIKIPNILSGLWEGVLRAVPKKKTSHMKKRHRQLAGKALKDVKAVNTCPGCGKPKKAHFLCPYCVAEIKESWKHTAKETAV